MKKIKEIPQCLVMCPKVGHGNPLTVIAVANLFEDRASYYLVDGSFVKQLSRLHQMMTESGEFSREYTKRNETLRSGIAAMVIGVIQLTQWLANERLRQFRDVPLANIGIFVQEHLLGVIPEEILKRLFPEGIFLYIPDVFPKESAVEILKRLKNIATLLVWNKSAWLDLMDQGLTPILVAPVLPERFLPDSYQERMREERPKTPHKIVIKTSGSGIEKELDEWLKREGVGRLESEIKQKGADQIIEYWLPNKKIVYGDTSQNGEQTTEISDLAQYGKEFYLSLLDASVIISYPSEMVQVAAWLKAHGWLGKFIVLPPRGAHERRNLKWAQEMGLIDGLIEKTDQEYQITKIPGKFNPDSFKKELGITSVDQIVSLARRCYRQSRRVAISSEAKKLYPAIMIPSPIEEMVIKDPEELEPITDFSQIVGLHFRPKKAEGFWEKFEEVIKKAIEKVPKENDFYLSIHLEDFSGLSEEKIKERLFVLNELIAGTRIKILLENVTPRVDQKIDPSLYSLLAFYQKYSQIIADLPNIGFCLDIAHLGLAEPEVFLVLEKYYQAKEDGWPYPEMMLADDERDLFSTFQQLLKRTKVLHWSRSRGLEPMEKRVLFKIFESVLSRLRREELKEKGHRVYTLIENLISAHYPISTESDLFVILTSILKNLGWGGTIVIESPAILEMIRDQKRPFNYFKRLESLTSPKAKIDLDYFSQGRISELDLDDLASFLEPEYALLHQDFFSLLKKTFSLILDIYNGQRRKVNGGLYLRHILKTTMVAYRLASTFDFDDEIKERIILGALLHDVFEMNPGYNQSRLVDELRGIFSEKDENWFNLIYQDVGSLTPPAKDPNLSYIERKKVDFERFIPKDETGTNKPFNQWSKEEKIRLLIKVADVYANLYETVDDLNRGFDDKLMEKALEERIQVFKERVERISQIIADSSLIGKLDNLIMQLIEYLPR